MQRLVWANLRWEKGKPDSVVYGCEGCSVAIEEWQKTEMLERGVWVASEPELVTPKIRGYHLNSLYAPVGWSGASWSALAKMWEDAQGKPELLKTFLNTVLGETWKESGDAPPWKEIYDRRESYPTGTIPHGGVILTAGCDVQQDRIECEIVAWGRHGWSWSIDYFVFDGDTQDLTGNGPWSKLDELLEKNWLHENGKEMKLHGLAVDQGFATTVVQMWCRRKLRTRVFCVYGKDNYPAIVGPHGMQDINLRGKRQRRGVRAWPVGTNLSKLELYGRLRLERPTDVELEGWPHGYAHFPEYEAEYFKQLTAETRQIKIKRGFAKPEWHKVHERNEALDCRVYARAAASIVGIDRWKDEHWRVHEEALGVDPEAPPRQSEPKKAASAAPAPAQAPKKRRPHEGFLDRWRGH
jgi:phage terminase large subunit GpA-like protein